MWGGSKRLHGAYLPAGLNHINHHELANGLGTAFVLLSLPSSLQCKHDTFDLTSFDFPSLLAQPDFTHLRGGLSNRHLITAFSSQLWWVTQAWQKVDMEQGSSWSWDHPAARSPRVCGPCALSHWLSRDWKSLGWETCIGPSDSLEVQGVIIRYILSSKNSPEYDSFCVVLLDSSVRRWTEKKIK